MSDERKDDQNPDASAEEGPDVNASPNFGMPGTDAAPGNASDSGSISVDPSPDPLEEDGGDGDWLEKGKAWLARFERNTLAGLGLAALFFLFLWVDRVNVRWWIMLPLGGASAGVLHTQRHKTAETERKLCVWAFWTVVALLVLRDIRLSSALAGILDKAGEFQVEFNRMFGT
jgi:hypothetical protein